MMNYLLPATLRERQRFLAQNFDVTSEFETLEESCIPSYLHKNIFASWVSWNRLTNAAKLLKESMPSTNKIIDILDFGAGCGELIHMIPPLKSNYHFTETNEKLSEFILKTYQEAVKVDMNDQLVEYDAIFALDSIEHNVNYKKIVTDLSKRVKLGGILILCGPTENFWYKFGRLMAGFTGHYHDTNIYEIEKAFAANLTMVKKMKIPLNNIPLFSLSVWLSD
jgi:hypothetical protein